MDEIEKNITIYRRESNISKLTLCKQKGIDIEDRDFHIALCKCLNIDGLDPIGLLNKQLTHQQMTNLLKDYDFSKKQFEFLTKVELEEPILPGEIPRIITEQTVKQKNEIWIIHKNDQDPFPSSPHAHNRESGISLHLGTGELFDKRQSKGFIKCKELKTLRNKIISHELPELQC
jgi:hypothetical protein